MPWYALVEKVGGRVASFTTDDVKDFALNMPNHNVVGPYATQEAAQAIHTPPAVDPKSATVTTLLAKPSVTWTTSDVADYLKATHR